MKKKEKAEKIEIIKPVPFHIPKKEDIKELVTAVKKVGFRGHNT